MTVSTLNTAALSAAETAIRNALEMDPLGRERLGTLTGKIFHLHCQPPEFDVYLMPTDQGLILRATFEDSVDCRISGAGSEFIDLLTSSDKPSALINGGLSVQGDTAPLLELQEILVSLDIDWEARLAGVVGDIPAHQFGRAMRQSMKWGRNANTALLRHVEEFIHEEARLAPPPAEIEDFYDDLQRLQLRVQRLEARLKRQQRRVHKIETR